MARIEIIIYDDDGNIIGRLVGPVDPKLTEFPNGGTRRNLKVVRNNPVADIAQRNGCYVAAADHMNRHPGTLRLHDDLVLFCNARSDCGELVRHARAAHQLWWLWYDTEDLELQRFNQRLKEAAHDARVAYGDWLASMFDGHGRAGTAGRYTVKRYVAQFKRGDMRNATYDARMDSQRERLEMLRRGIIK